VHTAHQNKDTYILENLDGSVFKHIITGNNLKPFRVRTAYTDANTINGQETTTLLGRDETDNNKTNQTKDEAAALKTKKRKIERENKIFLDKSYIPENRIFAVII
jgi:hypothetical protein